MIISKSVKLTFILCFYSLKGQSHIKKNPDAPFIRRSLDTHTVFLLQCHHTCTGGKNVSEKKNNEGYEPLEKIRKKKKPSDIAIVELQVIK